MDDTPPPRSSMDSDVLETAVQNVAAFKQQHPDSQPREEQSSPSQQQQQQQQHQQVPCSIVLSDKRLTSIPEALVDIIKDDADRLALNRNRLTSLSGLGPRFAEFQRLKYLNMRENCLEEFPPQILSVTTLEVLDLKGNKIRTLPTNLDALVNLRLLEIKRNRVEAIPTCVANMKKLTRLGHRKNNIKWPPLKEWAPLEQKPRSTEEENNREKDETQELKKVLQKYASKRGKPSEVEQSEDKLETPRPTKRQPSGRFPIRPSVDLSSAPTPPSPYLQKQTVPPKPNGRTPNGLLAALKPDTEPMFLNERNRSNSESQMSGTNRSKRMALQLVDSAIPSWLNENKLNRLSHNRGLSHGSALTNGVALHDSSSPTEPLDNDARRHIFGKRLSSLPEDRRKSRFNDPNVELAHSILYALEQLQGPIKHIAVVVKEGNAKRSSLERTRYNTFSFVENLSKQLLNLETITEEAEDIDRRRSISMPDTAETCIKLFNSLVMALQRHSFLLASEANPRYMRTLLHLLYASIVELRNGCTKYAVARKLSPSVSVTRGANGHYDIGNTVRPTTSLRIKKSPLQMNGSQSKSPRRGFTHAHAPRKPTALSGSISSTTSQFPALSGVKDGASSNFMPSPVLTRSNTMTSIEEDGEDRQFEAIFITLQNACKYAGEVLPRILAILSEQRRSAADELHMELENRYTAACELAKAEIEKADRLRERLSSLKLKEQRFREHVEFWQICTAFTNAHMNFVSKLQDMERSRLIHQDIKHLLRPVQRLVKEANNKIKASPWQSLAGSSSAQPSFSSMLTAAVQLQQPTLSLQTRLPSALGSYPNEPWSANSSHSLGSQGLLSSGYVTPASGGAGHPSMPATPLSAALGPAAQATLPPTSSSTQLHHGYFLQGHWPERSKSFSRR